MSAVDYLLNARATLDTIGDLVTEAAASNRPASEIAEDVLGLVREVRNAIDVLADDEGTE